MLKPRSFARRVLWLKIGCNYKTLFLWKKGKTQNLTQPCVLQRTWNDTETNSEGEKCSFALIKKLNNLCCWLGSILPCLGSQTFPALTLHMAKLVTVITLYILLRRAIQGLSKRLMLERLRTLMVVDVLLKGFCTKCLLWGGYRSTAAKLLFPTILLQKFGA